MRSLSETRAMETGTHRRTGRPLILTYVASIPPRSFARRSVLAGLRCVSAAAAACVRASPAARTYVRSVVAVRNNARVGRYVRCPRERMGFFLGVWGFGRVRGHGHGHGPRGRRGACLALDRWRVAQLGPRRSRVRRAAVCNRQAAMWN